MKLLIVHERASENAALIKKDLPELDITVARSKREIPAAIEDVDVDGGELGQGKRLVWESMEPPPARGAGRLIDGTAQEAAQELMRLMHEEAKVI